MRNPGRLVLASVLCLLAISLFAAAPVAAQVSLTTLGVASSQSFDTLISTGSATWTNNSTIPGWYHQRTGTGTTIVADTGTNTAGNLYSYGAAASTDRAIGSLGSGNAAAGNFFWGVRLQNNTGATITQLAISYTGEQWRNSAAAAQTIAFSYLVGSPTVTGSLAEFQTVGVPITSLDFTSPVTGGTAGALVGNNAPNKTAVSFTITGLSIPNGTEVMLRWSDPDHTGTDHGLSIDDFSVTPQGSTPLPNLTVNDVSLNEGNAGTTSFTFTVSLSAPAGPGGVTFNIATADGTAQDDNPVTEDNDYQPKSLSAQTIPAGSSTYSFTVLVNGDTTPETNETFFVNVASVTGATVTDGQGQGTIVNDDAANNLTINDVSLNEGNAGTTSFTFTVSLSAPAGPGGVTFDIATADGTAQDDNPVTEDNDYQPKSLTSQTIPAGSSTFSFSVLVNGDTAPEGDETFFVNVANVTNALATDSQGQGTIVNDDLNRIHDLQGNGAATPIGPATTVSVEGVVTGNFQGNDKLQGFFLQEENADADADPATSEGIFVFCISCPTPVAEGQRVKATGLVSEFFNMTELTASTAGSVVVTDVGNHLAEVTPVPLDLPVVGVIDDYYEPREAMLVSFVDPLLVSEYFELFRYGQIELYEGGRPRQFTEASPPNVAGNTAYQDVLARRRVILDDDDNTQNVPLLLPEGMQFVWYPKANGGFSIGTQGTDFFRGGDLVNGLTGILHWSFAGQTGTDAWRIRPTNATPATFTVANPRPATAPAVGGAIKAASMNLLNYFTTIDTTSSTSSGPCGPSGTLDCRGADSVAELNRQRERASIVICTLNADVYGFMELENTTASATINDLLGAVNTLCGGAHPYAAASTGGTLGTDAIRVQIVYRTGVLSPVGAPLVDLDPIHNRPPTAQTFDVVDATNAAFGERFTVIANHSKSKGCDASATGSDADSGDGQSCYAGRRTSQSARLLTWISSTVVPAAGDPDVLMVGDFNSYARETPTTTLTSSGFVDIEDALLGANAYSYLFDGQLGHIDYTFASTSLFAKVTGVGPWHINADEVPLLDYNDEVKDVGESAFEEKPDGSALVPPRVMFQPLTPYRASDHDPVLVGLFPVADISVTKGDAPDPVIAGNNLTYTLTATNAGPDVAASVALADTLPAGTTFVSLSSPAGWSCTTPAVGSGGTVSCTNPSLAVGSAAFTLVVQVNAATTAGTVISNTATVSSTTGDPNPGDHSATTTTTVATSANLSITKVDTPDPVTAGNNLTYTITATNAGPSNAATVALADTLPAGTTFVSLSSPAGWSCTTPAVGAGGTVSCTNPSLATGSAAFTLVVKVGATVTAGTVLSNTATVSSATSDPSPGNESATATTTVAASADLSVTKVDTPDPVNAGSNLTYTVTVANAGPSNAATASLSDTLPTGTTFVSLASPAGWSCTTPAVGSGGTVSCTNPSVAIGSAVFTLVVQVGAGVAPGTVISNTATVTAATTDPVPGNGSATATTTVGTGSADLQVTKVDTPDPVTAGNNLTYTITATNAGPSAAATAALSDTLPTGTTFVSLSSPAGWSCTTPAVGAGGTVSCTNPTFAPGSAAFTLVVKVGASVASGTVISNTATASAATSDPTPGNNSATATTTVTASADLSVTNVDTPDPVTAGNNLTYTITATNAGPSNAAATTLSEPLTGGTTFVSLASPAGWSCTTPAVGAGGNVSCTNPSFAPGSAAFTLVVKVGAATATGTVISNTAMISSSTTDATPGNNSATATTTVATSADLALTKTDGSDPVQPGTNEAYTLTLTNNGPSDAAGLSLSDPLPASTTFVSLTSPAGWSCTTPAVGGTGTVTCTASSLAAAASAGFTLTVQVAAGATPGSTITNTATVTSTTTDGSPGNESATATSTVGTGSADLSLTKTDSVDPVQAGASLTYTLTLTNGGPNPAANVSLGDPLPASTTFSALTSPAGWSCTTPAVGATGTVTCTRASFAPGSAVFSLTVQVAAGATAGSTLSNTASVTSTTPDPTPGSESDTETTTIAAATAISATKSASGSFAPGSDVTYTIVISNAGPQAQNDNPGDEFTDILPPELVLVAASADSGATATTGNTVTWNGVIPAGGAVTITIQAAIPDNVSPGTQIANQGTVRYDANGDGINDTSAATDDPASGGGGDPTVFAVVLGQPTIDVPTLDEVGLAALAILLGLAALVVLRRRS